MKTARNWVAGLAVAASLTAFAAEAQNRPVFAGFPRHCDAHNLT